MGLLKKKNSKLVPLRSNEHALEILEKILEDLRVGKQKDFFILSENGHFFILASSEEKFTLDHAWHTKVDCSCTETLGLLEIAKDVIHSYRKEN